MCALIHAQRSLIQCQQQKNVCWGMARYRNRKYIDWIKTQPCCMCMVLGVDPHHLKGVGHMSGTGLTAPDTFAMPLCRPHHDEMHASPELWPDQWEYIARTLARAVEEGFFASGES